MPQKIYIGYDNFKEKKGCCNCKYWFRSEEIMEVIAFSGECRRFPPNFIVGRDFAFNVSEEQDWCGEWVKTTEEWVWPGQDIKTKA